MDGSFVPAGNPSKSGLFQNFYLPVALPPICWPSCLRYGRIWVARARTGSPCMDCMKLNAQNAEPGAAPNVVSLRFAGKSP